MRQLRDSGAIVLGKTNVPQLMLLHEVDNPVYGRTNNPWNLERGPGGSTGGEAAIIAAGGSPWGLGSDLGGSIRQPAHSCGISGLKPTTGRLTGAGKRSNFRGMEAIGVQPGPMARSVADLELMLHTLLPLGAEDDFQVAPVPLGRAADVSLSRLRVGVWHDDGFFGAAPGAPSGCARGRGRAGAAGVTVVEFSPPDVAQVVCWYIGILSADGGADFRRTLGRSMVDWRIRRLLRLGALPAFSRTHLSAILRLTGQRRLAELVTPRAGRQRTAIGSLPPHGPTTRIALSQLWTKPGWTPASAHPTPCRPCVTAALPICRAPQVTASCPICSICRQVS